MDDDFSLVGKKPWFGLTKEHRMLLSRQYKSVELYDPTENFKTQDKCLYHFVYPSKLRKLVSYIFHILFFDRPV